MAKKSSKGKQRIDMKKIENESHLLVTFSRRRSGLFKKAAELSTLTGAELAVIAFSPSGKPFTFGSPSIDQVLNNLEHGGGGSRAPIGGNGDEVAEVLMQIGRQREAEKKRAEVAAERAQKRAEEEQSMELPELVQMREAVEAFRRRVSDLQALRPAEFNPRSVAPFAAGPSSVGGDMFADPAAAGTSSGGGDPFAAGPSLSGGAGGSRRGPGGPI